MGKKQTGFTIVELAVVIVIIGILAAITIATYRGAQNKSYDTTVQGDLQNIAAAMKTYRANTGAYPASETSLSNMDTVEGVNPRVTRSAYDVTSPANPQDPGPDGLNNARNLLICKRDGSSPKFGIAVLSKSGKVWFYTSDGGLVESDEPWAGQQSVTCPRLGISLSDSGYARWFGYQRAITADVDSGWRGWATK